MKPIKVGIFDVSKMGKLAGPQNQAARMLFEVLQQTPGINAQVITAKQLRQEKLCGFDVFVMPGGGIIEQQQWALGLHGRKIVRDFVRHGGGYFGICSGAYLATNARFGWLSLVDVQLHDMKHQNRGGGLISVKFNQTEASALLSDRWIQNGKLPMLYWQGPLMLLPSNGQTSGAKRDKDFGYVHEIASFASVIKAEASQDERIRYPEYFSDLHMSGYAACVYAKFGSGRVFISSPHLELPKENQGIIPEIIRNMALP